MKYLIKTSILMMLLVYITASAQEKIYFTTINDLGTYNYWRINTSNGSSNENISLLLNSQTSRAGDEHGPISVSKNGTYVIFQSERFDDAAMGWEAITISNNSFTSFTVPKLADSSLIRAEGLLAISNSGDTILYTDGSGTHSRDIFMTYKDGSNWSIPLNLTSSSSYDYNANPYLSSDGRKILFDAGAASYPTTAIGQIELNGGLSFPITTSSIPSSTLVKSGAFLADGSIVFECETDAERIWKHTGLTNTILNSTATNDNSPIVLPSGKIASVYLPAGLHHIKIMDNNGSNDYMLTNSNPNFNEIEDIGISSGGSSVLLVEDMNNNSNLNIYPNPVKDILTIDNIDKITKIEIRNVMGEIVYSSILNDNHIQFDISLLEQGYYLLSINNTVNKSIIKQ